MHFGRPLAPFWFPLAHFWFTCCSLWLPFGCPWLSSGSVLVPFGALLPTIFSLWSSPASFFIFLWYFHKILIDIKDFPATSHQNTSFFCTRTCEATANDRVHPHLCKAHNCPRPGAGIIYHPRPGFPPTTRCSVYHPAPHQETKINCRGRRHEAEP